MYWLILYGICATVTMGLGLYGKTYGGSNPHTGVSSNLYSYLLSQQLAALSGETPGALTQRAFTNPNDDDPATGNTYGAINSNLFLKRAKAGYTPFDVDALLTAPGTCAKRAWISPNHYLGGCSSDHGVTETATSRFITESAMMFYSATVYTGTLCKLLPWWYGYLIGTQKYNDSASNRMPAFALMFNTYEGAGITAETEWIMPVDFITGVGAAQYEPADSRFSWQKQYNASYQMATAEDSGSPIFCGVNGEPVILSFVEAGLTMGAADLAIQHSLIRAKMRELSAANGGPNPTTVAPLVADLSGFY